MVQDMWPKEYGGRPGPPWEYERLRADQRQPDVRLPPEAGGGPPRPSPEIFRTITDQWRIPAHHFFMAAYLNNGEIRFFSGPGQQIPDASVARFFNKDTWVREVQRANAGLAMAEPEYSFSNEYPRSSATPSSHASRRNYDRRRDSSYDAAEEEGLAYKGRKRARPHPFRRPLEIAEDEAPVPIVSPHKGIKIGNSGELWDFYGQRFKNCQQTACKLIAKAWIKAVEPKKQSNHPYTGSDEKAPDWWPRPSGTDKVRHKEPDHLFKRERVYLLCHILRMVIEPIRNQHADIQKLNLNVSKLEEVTMEALNNFFGDKENPNNARKKPYLKEIFKIAKMEERYRNGEMDADHEVYIIADDKVPETYQSDAEDSSGARDREGGHSGASSKRGISPHKTHDMMSDHSPAGTMASDPFSLPVRDGGAHYSQPMLPPELTGSGADAHGFVEVHGGPPPPPPPPPTGMVVQGLGSQPGHEGSRRSSQVFASANDFNAAYAPAAWPQGPGTTGPTASAMYAYTHQQQPPAHSHYGSQVAGVPVAQGQAYMTPGMDGLPTGPYEMAGQPPQGLYRHASVSQSPVAAQAQQAGYPPFLHGDARSMSSSNMKMEGMGRGHM